MGYSRVYARAHTPESVRKLNSSALEVFESGVARPPLGCEFALNPHNPRTYAHKAWVAPRACRQCGLGSIGLCDSLCRRSNDWWAHRKPLQRACCALLPLGAHKGVRAQARACAFAWVCACASLRACAPALLGPSACATCVSAYVCVSFAFACAYARLGMATQACTTRGYSRAAPLVLAGHQRRVLGEYPRGTVAALKAYSCSWGILWGT